MVHHVDGPFTDSYYRQNTAHKVREEIREQQFFAFHRNYAVVIDISSERVYGTACGEAKASLDRNDKMFVIPASGECFNFKVAAHELGHTFGLRHDFRNNAYIMSYGSNQNKLSKCAAEWLDAHRFFNSSQTSFNESAQINKRAVIQMLQPLAYSPKAVRLRFEVTDPDGLHQAQLIIPTEFATFEEHTAGVRTVAFSPDGTIVASGTGDDGAGEIKLWDVTTQRNIATFWHPATVRTVAFSPDETILASSSRDGEIKLWDLTTQRNIASLGHPGEVASVAFSPDGTILAFGTGRAVKLWDLTTQRNIASLGEHAGAINSVAFSPDGTIVASGAGDSAVKLWDVTTRINIATFWHTDAVSAVAFSPDGTTLASATVAGTVELWDYVDVDGGPC